MSVCLALNNTYLRQATAELLDERGVPVSQVTRVMKLEPLVRRNSIQILVLDSSLPGLAGSDCLDYIDSLVHEGHLQLIVVGAPLDELDGQGIKAPEMVRPNQLAAAIRRLRKAAGIKTKSGAPPAWQPRSKEGFSGEYSLDNLERSMQDRLEDNSPEASFSRSATGKVALGRVGVKKITKEEFEELQKRKRAQAQKEAEEALCSDHTDNEAPDEEGDPRWNGDDISVPPAEENFEISRSPSDFANFSGYSDDGISVPSYRPTGENKPVEGNGPVKCPYCQAERIDPKDTFCRSCGQNYPDSFQSFDDDAIDLDY